MHRMHSDRSILFERGDLADHLRSLKAVVVPTTDLTPWKIGQFIPRPPESTPGNVGIAISGGGSRSMVAGMGQLRALKALCNAQGTLLGQTKAISAVSGGSWLSVPFTYLSAAVSDKAFLGPYQEPEMYTVEGLQYLADTNIGMRCTKKFSAKNLSLEAVLLIIAGLPPPLVWQVLIGIHILQFYDLYVQSEGLADSFFSYDENTLKEILYLNPSLIKKTVALVATGKDRLVRPFLICNASMLVNTPEQFKQSLVPVQITPFFTGVFSTPAHAVDANNQPVGGGGVTSFAFNSALEALKGDMATLRQIRPFCLADAAGVSSSFFAAYLGKQWNGNIKDFFAYVKDRLSYDRMSHLFPLIPAKSRKFIRDILSKLEKLQRREGNIDNEQLLKVGIDPGIFYDAFKKLASLVPQYRYWSVHSSCSQHIQPTVFADGGSLENSGIAALLLYEDIDNVIACVNSSTPLAQASYGIIDSSGQEIPDTCIEVDSMIPPLFGYQPYNDQEGYQLYSGETHPIPPFPKNNQIFPKEAFAELLQGLWQVSGNKHSPGSNQHAANYLQSLTTVENTWFGIKAGKQLKVLWVYNNLINDWYEQLSDAVRQQVFNNDPTHYYDFPHYSTVDMQLTPTQVNLLASQTSWSLFKGSPNEILRMYQA